MVQKSGKSNPLMNEGAGGADVPQALFYFIGDSDPEDTKNKHMSVKHMLVKGQMSIKTRL